MTRTVWTAILAVFVVTALTMSVGVNAQGAVGVRSARLVDIEHRLAEIKSTEADLMEDMRSPDPILPKADNADFLVGLRAEAIALNKERDKLLKDALKHESKDRKEAREQLQKEFNDATEVAESAERLRGLAGISGCSSYEEQEKTIIVPGNVGSGGYAPHLILRVINREKVPIDISEPSGPVVYSLCPGGEISLYRSIGTWADDRSWITVQYSASARSATGRSGLAHSNRYTIRSTDRRNGRREQKENWEVRLNWR